ncbi:hypothetical protein GWK47_024280 [Chionoecetes opilio]|uniref:Uncharacterized protein n=1 Tax=Chionoecetes opilio TaxID=41210 RepID=A0A8J4XVJ1_CHIOP|nr:hypothetical protein GWK47_024280 [Chionoecetes opilio]
MAIPPLHRQDSSRPPFPPGKMQSTGTQKPSPGRRKKIQESAKILGGGVRSGLTYPATQEGRQGAPEKECIRPVAHLRTPGSENSISTSPLPEEYPPSHGSPGPPHTSASLTGFKPNPGGGPGESPRGCCTDHSTFPQRLSGRQGVCTRSQDAAPTIAENAPKKPPGRPPLLPCGPQNRPQCCPFAGRNITLPPPTRYGRLWNPWCARPTASHPPFPGRPLNRGKAAASGTNAIKQQ